MKPKIAIIGSGISGLSSAFNLYKDYEITVYEKDNRLGGHVDTHELNIGGTKINIDSAFIIFCRKHYPHFTGMLDKLKVQTQVSNMSLSVWNQNSELIYNASTVNKLFCDRKNLANMRFYRMLFDIILFYKRANKEIKCSMYNKMSVKEYFSTKKYGQDFIHSHLYPVIGALWSAKLTDVEQFPINHLVEFMEAHSMMNLFFRPEWRVIKSGSTSYIEALQSQIRCKWKVATPVLKIKRYENSINLTTQSGQDHFDAVILATHADQALSLLEKPTLDEKATLSKFKYQSNNVIVHTDDSVMHQNRLSWGSWNAQVHSGNCSITYWMNLLQSLDVKTNVFVTLNPEESFIDNQKILKKNEYRHPIFNTDSVNAINELDIINGKNRTFFAGAYNGWGIHEDGARSGYDTSELLKKII